MNELRPVLNLAGSARFTPETTPIKTLHPSVVYLAQEQMLEGVHALRLFIWTHLQPFEPKKRKNQFSGGKSAKSLEKRSTVRQTCSKTLVRYLGRSMGHYPFGIFGIQPKMRSGRRFENQNQHLQPYTAPNCKNQFLGGVNRQKGLQKRCTVHQTCSKNLVRYLGSPMGPYPFGIFKIRPEIRSGRKFEKKMNSGPI